jgi:hypothetical protein
MKAFLALILVSTAAHAAPSSTDSVLCESNDGKYSIQVTKGDRPLFTVGMDKDIPVKMMQKTDPKYTKDVLDWFEGESQMTGKFNLRITDVKGEAGHAAMFEDSTGKHLVNCHYDPPSSEPKAPKKKKK